MEGKEKMELKKTEQERLREDRWNVEAKKKAQEQLESQNELAE
jgi:hypothetical protein